MASCGSSRKATRETQRLRVEGLELRDSSLVERVEVHDTLREVTTITVDRNDRGDTLRLVQVTERDRFRDRDRVRDEQQKTVVKTDTVYIERKDSVAVSNTNLTNTTNKKSNFVAALKWIFGIILAAIVFIIVVKFGRRSLF